MSGGFIALLGLQGLLFAAWSIYAFRCMFKIFARAVAVSGNGIPGMAVGLRTFRSFAVAPEYARDRKVFLVLSLLLFILIGAVVALAPGASPR